MGSYPILSNIPPYQAFISENSGYILKDYTLESLDHLYGKILNNELKVTLLTDGSYKINYNNLGTS